MVREEGLEPSILAAGDFKSPVYTIPPLSHYLVRLEGLEPPRLAALEPKSSVSANFTTSA